MCLCPVDLRQVLIQTTVTTVIKAPKIYNAKQILMMGPKWPKIYNRLAFHPSKYLEEKIECA